MKKGVAGATVERGVEALGEFGVESRCVGRRDQDESSVRSEGRGD
jgi:hypothetical protein